ncbi:hypothetical protein B0O99DRAFT_737365 [Bisporella sp. PMI_857]|nr:hypothetical protein B0O99DRAFT_682690 [Bisporella sp. PMI_857]KAH8600610.1 hypothetical protein B0O99DRAFT_737365 [Bisporella sp. PMI_857]
MQTRRQRAINPFPPPTTQSSSPLSLGSATLTSTVLLYAPFSMSTASALAMILDLRDNAVLALLVRAKAASGSSLNIDGLAGLILVEPEGDRGTTSPADNLGHFGSGAAIH